MTKIDYYNYLKNLSLDLQNKTILDPAAFKGQVLKDLEQYIIENNFNCSVYATDRGEYEPIIDIPIGYKQNFLSDDYVILAPIDFIISFPPSAHFQAFLSKSLEVAKEGVVLFSGDNYNFPIQSLYPQPSFKKGNCYYWKKY